MVVRLKPKTKIQGHPFLTQAKKGANEPDQEIWDLMAWHPPRTPSKLPQDG
jgi:hypothetical protein